MKSATRFLKRFACLALAAILSLTCLAACGGGEGGGGSGKTKLKVFLYMNDHEKEVYSAMVEKFKEAHADEVSDIEFQITTQSEYATTLTGMMTANDMPDVFYVGPERVKDYVSNGYVANLTPSSAARASPPTTCPRASWTSTAMTALTWEAATSTPCPRTRPCSPTPTTRTSSTPRAWPTQTPASPTPMRSSFPSSSS